MDLRHRFADIMSETPSVSGIEPQLPETIQQHLPCKRKKRSSLFTMSLIALAVVIVIMLYNKKVNGVRNLRKSKDEQILSEDVVELQSENGAEYDQTDPLFQPFEY